MRISTAKTRERLGGESVSLLNLVNQESIALLCERIDDSFHISELLLSLVHEHTVKWWDHDLSFPRVFPW